MFRKHKTSFQNWSYLGWSDIQARYRRSRLGVFWITLSTLASSIAIAYVYSAIFNVEFKDYLPYITLGICFWNFIAGNIIEIVSSLIQNRQLLLGRKIEPNWIWYRLIIRNLIVLVHSLVVVLPILYFFDENLTLKALATSALAVLLVSIILHSFCGFLSILSVRFGDLPQAITAIIGLAFLITPVLWNTTVLSAKRSFLLDVNIFHHMIVAMRSPLLGEPVSLVAWYVLIVSAVFSVLLNYAAARNFRKSYMPWL